MVAVISPADHHDGERLLHFGTETGSNQEWRQTQHGSSSRHQHGAKTLLAAFSHRFGHA